MTEQQLRTWQKLHVAVERLRREVGREWRERGCLSEAEFTVLAHLAVGGRQGLRPGECAQAMGWDSSRLAHQLRRLEERALVVRTPDEDDGRATVVRLTEEGRSAHRAAVGPHLRSAKSWFADALSVQQVTALEDALDALLSHTGGPTAAGAPVATP